MKQKTNILPNILLVDDRPENLVAFSAVLKSEEYNLVEVSSGEEALRELMDKDFALILMDVQMPGLSGFETAMLIKKREKSEFIPLIFVTASYVDEHSAEQGYRIGAVDYILKPFNPEALKAKVLFFSNFYQENKKSQQQLEVEREFHKIIEVVSHDLKNPLSSMKLHMQMLDRAIAKEDSNLVVEALKNKLPAMKRSASQMQELIEGILDLAKVEGTKMQLDKKETNIYLVVSEVIEMLTPHAEIKNITFQDLLNRNGQTINCDSERIRQVFSNLIGNAVKFVPKNGTIQISCEQKKDSIVFKIQDSGPGIELESLPHIFDRFWQARGTSNHGTGLGLSIAKWIVEAHGGKIWVESKIGVGSSFNFLLPDNQVS
ncbi:MAG TPA: ATP-binding protein [Bacteriovoracaceae bacterium]|nr:ATP-binding protein [Bacteriovoracaceae bacterium]